MISLSATAADTSQPELAPGGPALLASGAGGMLVYGIISFPSQPIIQDRAALQLWWDRSPFEGMFAEVDSSAEEHLGLACGTSMVLAW